MTGVELAQRFIAYTSASGHPPADPDEPMATLYGLDQVVLDYRARTVLLPGIGLVQCPTLRPASNVGWYATTLIPNVGLQFVMGEGDPFTPASTNPLPTKGMFVMALPYAVLAAAAKPTNRAQRRAKRRA